MIHATRFVLVSLTYVPLLLALSACGSDEPDGPPPVYVEPGPSVRDSMSTETLEGINPDELGLALPWTSGEMNRRAVPGATTRGIEGIELIEREGFDRLIVTFEGDGIELPGYHLAYVDGPLADCAASPEEVSIDSSGEAFLELTVTGARAHDDRGQSTVGGRTVRGGSSNLNALRRTCDFEGVVMWAWDLEVGSPYRIMELHAPPRLVVDVQHPVEQPGA